MILPLPASLALSPTHEGLGAPLVAQREKNLSAYSTGDLGSIPGWEDPLEKGMATHYSILAWSIPWIEESEGLQSMGLQRVGYD